MAFIPKNILVTVGHSILRNGTCTSAGGHVQEYAYCKMLAPVVREFLLKGGANRADVVICPERKFTKSSQEKDYKLPIANSGKYDLVVELHLNAFNGSAKGTEVCYYPTSAKSKEVAQRINDKLDDIFVDRGIKARGNLYILNSTKPVAVLVEAFFCDSKEDYLKADEPAEVRTIARKIAEGILNKSLSDIPTTPPTGSESAKKYPNGDYDRKAKVVNTGDGFLNVRSGRGTNFSKVGEFKEGQIITVNYCLNNWFSTYSLGKQGFVSGTCIELL